MPKSKSSANSSALEVLLQHQTTGAKRHTYQRLLSLLKEPGLKRIRFAVAYARWDGIGLLAPTIEELLKGGGEFQCIYGVNNGVTTPDALLYSLYLRELYTRHTYAGAVDDKFANATFHPKFFEFRFADHTVALVGSANLTGGGMVRNTEMGLEVRASNADVLVASLDAAWTAMRGESEPTTIAKVRALKANAKLSDEGDDETKRSDKQPKPFLKVPVKVAPKPLFAKILDINAPKRKKKLLTELDPATQRPAKLYLQIFETETGGQGGSEGYQIQLPTATLPSYFGVGPDEGKSATFIFGKEVIETHFTHFYNNTHRLRLKPILSVHRPAILVFERIGTDQYRCSVVPKAKYAATLAAKCSEQTRAGARRWGLE